MADTPSRGGITGTYLQTVSYGSAPFGSASGQGAAWFGPLAPMQPLAPPDVAGRVWDFPVGYNLNTRVRAYERIGFHTLRELADGYDLLRAVIETRKDQLARMSWSIKGRDTEAKDDDDPRVKTLTAFFRRPDGVHGWQDWLRAVLEDLFVIDAPSLYAQRNRAGRLVSLIQLDGATIKPVIDDWGRTPQPYGAGSALVYPPAYQQVLKGLPAVNYSTRDLFYRPRNKRVQHAYGYSPVEQILTTVNIALRRQLTTLEYFTAGNMPDSLIGVPEGWTPDQIVSFQKHFDAMFVGDLAARRRAKFVPGGVAKTFVQTREPELKNDFDEWLAKLVCFAFSVSPQALIKQMNRASGETQKELAEEEGLEPILLWLKAWLDDIIELEFGCGDLEFSWDNDDEVDQAQQLAVLTGYVTKGIMTINESRQRLGFDPLPDAEASQAMVITATGFVPLNSYAQGQQQQADQMQANAEAKARLEASPTASPARSDDDSREPANVKKYSGDEPRDAQGRWTSSGGDKPLLSTKTKIKIGGFLIGSAALALAIATGKGTPFKINTETAAHEAFRGLHASSVKSPISDAEKKSVYEYTWHNFKSINKNLRLGRKPNADINNIDSALQKSSLSENTVVYRGLNKDRSKRLLQTQPGQMFMDSGYPSTSLYEGVARNFAGTKDGMPLTPSQHGYVMSINVNQGANALPLTTGYTKMDDEFEVLLPRSSAFQILDVDHDTKTIYAQHLGTVDDMSKAAGVEVHRSSAGGDPEKFLWSDDDLEWFEPPDDETKAAFEGFNGYTPPQPDDVGKAYDPSEARNTGGEWTGDGSAPTASKPRDDWAEAKSIGKSIAVGAALTAAAAVAVYLAPEFFAAAGAVEATEAATTAVEGSKVAQLAGSLGRWVATKASNTVRSLPNEFIKGLHGAAQTAYFSAAYKSMKLMLRHVGVDTDSIEQEAKPLQDAYNEVMKAADTKSGGQLKDALAEVVDETRDNLIKHLAHYKGTDKYKAAIEIIQYAAGEFKSDVLSALGKVAKRSMGGYRQPVPFDRPATSRAEKGIAGRLGLAFAAVGKDAAGKLKDRLGKLAKVEPDPSEEDRARQIADEIASEFDFGPLQDTADDTADDLEDVAEDSVSSAVAQIGPSDPSDLVEQVNDRAVAAARDRAAEMVGMRWDGDGNLVPSTNPEMAITETTRDMLRAMIANALTNNESTDDLADQISESFALSPERAQMIAATEVTRANSEAALASYQAVADLGVTVFKAWLTAPQGCCDVCATNAAQGAIKLDDTFTSGDATPPSHPNCRCSLSPVVGDDNTDDDGD